jgi:catechol 2,3-dioxygenase
LRAIGQIKNPMGTLVDPQKLVEARKAGMTFAELNQRAYAGEFAPAISPDPRVLL